MDNTVTIVGNLTRQPELRFTTTGKPVANVGVAVNRLISRPGEERKEDTSFFDVTCWDSLANNVADLPSGTRVIVTGRLQQRSWETEEGEKRSRVEIVATDVGPSLRWATAEVTKNPKASPGGADVPPPSAYEEPF